MKPVVNPHYAVMQKVLSPGDLEALSSTILSIPGYEQNVVNGAEEGDFPDITYEWVVLPVANASLFVEHLPLDVIAAHPYSVVIISGEWIDVEFRYEARQITGDFLQRLSDAINSERRSEDKGEAETERDAPGVSVSVKDVWYATPPGGDCALKFVHETRLSKEAHSTLKWENGFDSWKLSPRPDEQTMAEYRSLVAEGLRSHYVAAGIPESSIDAQAKVEVRTGSYNEGGATPSTATVTRLRDAILNSHGWSGSGEERDRLCKLEFQFDPHLDASQRGRQKRVLQKVAEVLDACPPATAGVLEFLWRGLPKIDPEWLKLGTLTARLSPAFGPVDTPIGYIRVGPHPLERLVLSVFKTDQGSFLVTKGGQQVLADPLTTHFGIPWLCGESPVPLSGRLLASGTSEFKEPLEPAAFHWIPSFFREREPAVESRLREAFLATLDQAGYFENYPASAVAQARQDLAGKFLASSLHGLTPADQAMEVLCRWEEIYPWEKPLQCMLEELASLSYGLFKPENITVEFEDESEDEYPPEPGSEVVVAFDFAGERHEVAGEFYHGSVPAELMQFVGEVMSTHCDGVGFRGLQDFSSKLALCTDAALRRVIEAWGARELVEQ